MDWQVLYTPLFAACGLVWVWAIVAVTSMRARLLLAGGAVAWTVSQALENLAYRGKVKLPYWGQKTVAEEMLEMTGSTLFLLALLVTYRQLRQRDGDRVPSR